MYTASNSLKKAVSLGIFLVTVVLFAPAVKAQSPILLGGGLVFGTDIEALGIQVNGVYPLDEERGINLAGDLTLFFPDDAPGLDVSLFTINANGHYIFSTTETMMAYALAGLNIGFFKFETDFGGAGELFGDGSFTDTEIGLNAGAGAQFDVGFGYAYAEAKLVLGGFDQFVIGGGVRIPIGGN